MSNTRFSNRVNSANPSIATVSAAKISSAEDRALDRSAPKENTALAGLSVRNGPVLDEMDVDHTGTNGNSKRKSRSSISKINYRDDSESDDGQPLVSFLL